MCWTMVTPMRNVCKVSDVNFNESSQICAAAKNERRILFRMTKIHVQIVKYSSKFQLSNYICKTVGDATKFFEQIFYDTF